MPLPSWREPVDVLVVGAGAAGAAFTWSVSREGLQVLCLEQGDWVDPASYATTRADWEAARQAEWHPDPNVRRLAADYPVQASESPITPLMYNAVGGSTIHWSAHFPRFKPSDFRVKTLDGVGDDWPLAYEEIEPFFDLNDQMMGVAGLSGDPSYPPKSPRPTPPIPLGKLGETMARGFDRLGWHWWPSDSAIITRPYDGRHACNNCGPCDWGCPIGAKASTDITYWPKALASGARLVTRARVREITVGSDGLADGVIYHDAEGRVHEQKARSVVLAGNGIGTPRLLLNSRSGRFPDGLANGNGLVGRNLMFHPFAGVRGYFDEPLDGFKGPQPCAMISHQFYETDLARGFVRGYAFQMVRGFGPVNSALGGMGASPIAWGGEHHAEHARRWNHTIAIGVMGEDLPEADNRVVLDRDLSDANGIPAPRVIYRLSENSRRLLAHGIDRAKEALQAAGATCVDSTPLLQTAGWHLMGTARMGADPSMSVVDRYGRCHEVPNVYVVDGSLCTTSAAVNPTSTIQALALWVAHHFKQHVRRP